MLDHQSLLYFIYVPGVIVIMLGMAISCYFYISIKDMVGS